MSLSNYSGNTGGGAIRDHRRRDPSGRRRPFTSVYPNNGTVSGLTALSGGRLVADPATTSFAWDTFNLNNSSVLFAGDLANDIFQTIVYAPGTDVPLLAGPTYTANGSFQDVDVLAGSLDSGTLTLGVMGSAATQRAKLRLTSFPSGYEVESGESLAVADNVSVYIATSRRSPWTPAPR